MFSPRQWKIVGGIAILLVIVISVFIFGSRRNVSDQYSGKLVIWGIVDNPSDIQEIASAYRELQPNLEIVYNKIDTSNYEDSLINGLATAEGPDIFMIPNSWLPKHFDKIQPLTENQLSLKNFKKIFPTVVEQDFAPDGIIYALPLYIDTLAMFYNKDSLDTKGIALPPTTWKEFQEMVVQLRELDRAGRIVKAGTALGGSNKSIHRATDILNLLLLQTGTPMVNNDFSQARFSREGLNALTYYTQFANPINPYYTWNDNLPYSIDGFAEGKIAIIFDYSYVIDTLKKKNPFLNFDVAPMPQPTAADQNINWANYLGLTVSAKSRMSAAAWHFITWLTTDESASAKYLQLTGRSPALRSLIKSYSANPELGIFADQALSARSWPQIDNIAVENSFSKMIASVITGRLSAEKAIQQAENEITQLMERR